MVSSEAEHRSYKARVEISKFSPTTKIIGIDISKCINCESEYKPQEKGFYGVYIQNIRPSLPQYLEFDGKEWVNLESVKLENESNDIYWCEGEKALKELPIYNLK